MKKIYLLLMTAFLSTSLLASPGEGSACSNPKAMKERKLPYLKQGIKNYLPIQARNLYKWPFESGDPCPVGHACHSYQKYGFGQPYFHHGIDIRMNAGSVIYSSTGGKIVNIENYVAGNDLYWEVAVLDDEGFLWQYHHVEKQSIPQEIWDAYKSGQRIESGAELGKVVYWPASAYGMKFHHIHLNILDGEGNFLNPFLFLVRPYDLTNPVIHDIYFVADNGNKALDPQNLSGKVDILVRAEDLMDNQPYQLGIYKLEHEISSTDGRVVSPRKALWKFDRLPGGDNINKDVTTVYKSSFRTQNTTKSTSGNYSRREFYIVATNQVNGVVDANGCWDTTKVESGEYNIKVFATDFNGNSTEKTIRVKVSNK